MTRRSVCVWVGGGFSSARLLGRKQGGTTEGAEQQTKRVQWEMEPAQPRLRADAAARTGMEEEVGRLDIAMHNVLVMEALQPAQHLQSHHEPEVPHLQTPAE